MPNTQFPVSITVYDTDNTSLLSGATVYVKDTKNNQESENATSSSGGQASIDLGNLSTQWAVGDRIIVTAYKKVYGREISADYVFDIASGENSKDVTLYMEDRPRCNENTVITGWNAANNSASAGTAVLYDRHGGRLDTACVIARDSKPNPFGDRGKNAPGGFAVHRSAGTMVISVSQK